MQSLFALLALLAVSRAAPALVEDAQASVLLVTDSAPTDTSDCLASSYHGSYGGRADEHVYLPSSECIESSLQLKGSTQGGIVPLPASFGPMGGRLVWVGQAGVEGVVRDIRDDWTSIESLSRLASIEQRSSLVEQGGQTILGGYEAGLSLIHTSTQSMILHVPSYLLPVLDTLLPAHLVPVAIPLSPLPYHAAGISGEDGEIRSSEWKSVPEHYAKHLANITSHLKFDPMLDKVLSHIELNQVRRNVRWLTGEGPSGIVSRHSFTKGALKAAHWIKEQVEDTGADCHFEAFLPGFAPNVICSYASTANSTDQVILSAHYDSRGSWGSTVAPGGDDDGSGSGHLLAVAQTIGNVGVTFREKVVLAFFAGEEQGLYGSYAHAERLYKEKKTVLLHVQADMLGYRAPGEPLQLGLPASIHLPEATYLIANLSQLYSPELLVGRTAACCSDHQSFLSFGFPASQVFERNGPIADPKYHNSGDVSQREGYDFEQIVSIAKVTMASVMTVAGWDMPDA